jgi:hypothetical protein
MKTALKPILYWSPRVLGILFAAFISLFALDVFSEGAGFWETLLALLVHLVPTALIVLALLLSWRWEWLGAILFSGLGVLYIQQFWGRFSWPTYLIIAGPLALVGILFLVDWRYRTGHNGG